MRLKPLINLGAAFLVSAGVLASLASVAAEPAKVTLASHSDKVKTVEAEVVIDAPPAMVWQVLTNYGNFKNILPGYQKSDVLGTRGNVSTVDLSVKASPMLPPFRYRVNVQENEPARQITIRKVAGDFESIDASYKLMPAAGGDKTTVVYKLKIDVGANLPGVNHVLKSSTEKTMSAVQKACADQYRRSLTAKR